MRNSIGLLILRLSLAIVFFVFGIGKFTNDYWARTMAAMPLIQHLPWPTNCSVWIAGGLEIVTAFSFATGLLWRFAAILASVELLAILYLVQFQEIRDVGLLGAALFLVFYHNK